IRAATVTGVQTCALPIYRRGGGGDRVARGDPAGRGGAGRHAHAPGPRAGTRRAGGAARRPVKSWISVVDENATRTPPDCPVHAAGVRRAADPADARPACP